MELICVNDVMDSNPLHERGPFAEGYDLGAAYSSVTGEYVNIAEATVPMVDMGFMHADAAYDVVTVSRGNFFRLEEHLERMEKSCAKFELQSPYSREQTREILEKVVAKSGFKDAYVWWAVTRGIPAGPRSAPNAQPHQFYAFACHYAFLMDEPIKMRGLDMSISSVLRISDKAVDPTAKNFHWLDQKMALFEATRNSYDWAVLCDAQGYLTEAAGSNIFVIKDGVLVTPDSGCLEGITRKTVFDIAAELGLKTEARKVSAQELMDADEAFLSSSAGGIFPIRSVQGHFFAPDKSVGKQVTEIHNLYWEKRWSGWHATPVHYEAAGALA